MNTNTNQEQSPKVIFQVDNKGNLTPAAVVKGNALLEIPPAIYSVQLNPDTGYYLQPEDNFKLPERVYGSVNANVDRILRSFELNERNLGVLLIGVKGSGKTLTMKELMVKGNAMGLPGILINECYTGQAFLNFMSLIKQPVIVGLDEVDKVYYDPSFSTGPMNNRGNASSEVPQRTLIQMLDGTVSSNKKLFVLSANAEHAISSYLKNRPSRVRYTLRFNQLEQSTVVDYVSANLKDCNEDHIRAFLHVALAIDYELESVVSERGGMNFDTMRELVQEMNQFGGTLDDSLELMMVNGMRVDAPLEFDIFKDGKPVSTGTGRGRFNGAYLATADYSIEVQFGVILAEGHESVLINLTAADFVGFGGDLTSAEFKQGDYHFIMRYASREKQLTRITERVQRSTQSMVSRNLPKNDGQVGRY